MNFFSVETWKKQIDKRMISTTALLFSLKLYVLIFPKKQKYDIDWLSSHIYALSSCLWLFRNGNHKFPKKQEHGINWLSQMHNWLIFLRIYCVRVHSHFRVSVFYNQAITTNIVEPIHEMFISSYGTRLIACEAQRTAMYLCTLWFNKLPLIKTWLLSTKVYCLVLQYTLYTS